MFRVETRSPMDDRWQARDEEIFRAVGRHSESSGGGASKGCEGVREHIWRVPEFSDAVDLRDRLKNVQGVRVSIREQ